MSRMNNLVKQLNEASKNLSPDNEAIFTDMVVYIRLSNIKEKDAEEFLQQLLDSFLSAQEHGDSIKKVLGTDHYKDYCDKIIQAYKSSYDIFSRSGEFIRNTGIVITIMSIITFISQKIDVLKTEFKLFPLSYTFALGTLFQFIVIAALIPITFAWCKDSCFKKAKKNEKVKEFFILWGLSISFIAITYLAGKFLDTVVLFTAPILVIIPVGIALYYVGKWLSEK